MKFNTEKCKVIHIGVNNLKEEYFIGGKKLEEIMEEKDLGVIVSRNFKVSKQCMSKFALRKWKLLAVQRQYHKTKLKRTIELQLPLNYELHYALAAYGRWLSWLKNMASAEFGAIISQSDIGINQKNNNL
jgi:hypothetical protein